MRGECSHHTARPLPGHKYNIQDTQYSGNSRKRTPSTGPDRLWECKNTEFASLVPRPIRAIRVTRGDLEPSANFPTGLTSDVTSEIVENDWERGWEFVRELVKTAFCGGGRK